MRLHEYINLVILMRIVLLTHCAESLPFFTVRKSLLVIHAYPRTVLLAKKIRDEMTERVDLGEGAEEEIGGLLSDADGDLDGGDEGTGTVDMDMRAGAESNHTLSPSPTFPIVHKRSRRDRGDTGDSVLDLFKASMLQDREFRSEERERAAKERADERERRRERIARVVRPTCK